MPGPSDELARQSSGAGYQEGPWVHAAGMRHTTRIPIRTVTASERDLDARSVTTDGRQGAYDPRRCGRATRGNRT